MEVYGKSSISDSEQGYELPPISSVQDLSPDTLIAPVYMSTGQKALMAGVGTGPLYPPSHKTAKHESFAAHTGNCQILKQTDPYCHIAVLYR